MIFDDWLKYQHKDKNWICFLLSQNSNSIQSLIKSIAKFIMVYSIHVCTCQISTLSGKTAEGSPEESGEES